MLRIQRNSTQPNRPGPCHIPTQTPVDLLRTDPPTYHSPTKCFTLTGLPNPNPHRPPHHPTHPSTSHPTHTQSSLSYLNPALTCATWRNVYQMCFHSTFDCLVHNNNTGECHRRPSNSILSTPLPDKTYCRYQKYCRLMSNLEMYLSSFSTLDPRRRRESTCDVFKSQKKVNVSEVL